MSSHNLENRSMEFKCWQGQASPESCSRGSFLLLPASGVTSHPWFSLACGLITTSVITWLSPPRVCLNFSGQQSLDLEPTLLQEDLILL